MMSVTEVTRARFCKVQFTSSGVFLTMDGSGQQQFLTRELGVWKSENVCFSAQWKPPLGVATIGVESRRLWCGHASLIEYDGDKQALLLHHQQWWLHWMSVCFGSCEYTTKENGCRLDGTTIHITNVFKVLCVQKWLQERFNAAPLSWQLWLCIRKSCQW